MTKADDERHTECMHKFDVLFKSKVSLVMFLVVVGLVGGAITFLYRDMGNLKEANAAVQVKQAKTDAFMEQAIKQLDRIERKLDKQTNSIE